MDCLNKPDGSYHKFGATSPIEDTKTDVAMKVPIFIGPDKSKKQARIETKGKQPLKVIQERVGNAHKVHFTKETGIMQLDWLDLVRVHVAEKRPS